MWKEGIRLQKISKRLQKIAEELLKIVVFVGSIGIWRLDSKEIFKRNIS